MEEEGVTGGYYGPRSYLPAFWPRAGRGTSCVSASGPSIVHGAVAVWPSPRVLHGTARVPHHGARHERGGTLHQTGKGPN